MKKIRKYLLGLAALGLACAGYGFYMYKKKPADIRKEAAAYEVSAVGLLAEFNSDEPTANKKY